jgi:dipeptidase E
LNPHFLDPDPNSTHMGETREERIAQFHEENDTPVVGLREAAWLRVTVRSVVLGGTRGARIFRRGKSPVEKTTGDELSSLIGAPA